MLDKIVNQVYECELFYWAKRDVRSNVSIHIMDQHQRACEKRFICVLIIYYNLHLGVVHPEVAILTPRQVKAERYCRKVRGRIYALSGARQPQAPRYTDRRGRLGVS